MQAAGSVAPRAPGTGWESDLVGVYQAGERQFPLQAPNDELQNLDSVCTQPETAHPTDKPGH